MYSIYCLQKVFPLSPSWSKFNYPKFAAVWDEQALTFLEVERSAPAPLVPMWIRQILLRTVESKETHFWGSVCKGKFFL